MNDYEELIQLLGELSNYLDEFERKARLLDAALRFADANHPKEALIFRGCMEIVEAGDIQHCASPEHKARFHRAYELVARILAATSKISKSEASH